MLTRASMPMMVRVLIAVSLLATAAHAQEGELVGPQLKQFISAELPADAPDKNTVVQLLITIDDTGTVTEVSVTDGPGEPWNSAAVAAAKRFEFVPATQGGKPIVVRVPFNFRFRKRVLKRGRFVATRMKRRALHPTPGYRLAGTIVEKGTRTPLPGIAVGIEDPATGQAFEVVSDDQGHWKAYGLPPGPVRLVIVTGEHKPIQLSVRGTAPPDGNEDAPIDLTETVYLDPVGFNQYRTVIKDKPKPKGATEISLTEDELTQVPGTFGDPTRVVASLPGVARSPFGLGYYVVRGASFENTGFFIDGHPALFLYHLLGGPGVIHPELVGNLTFYPGGYPAEFGRFATGAILLTTKDPPDDRWHGDVQFDLLKASVLFSVPFDDNKGMVTGTVRRSYYELIVPLIVDDFSLSYLDYQLRLTYEINRDLRIKFLSFGAEDALGQGGESATGETSESELALGFHRLMFNVDWDFAKHWSWTNSIAWEYDRTSSRRAAEDDDTIDVGLDGWFFSLKHAVRWEPDDDFYIQGGFDGVLANVDAQLRIPSFPPLSDPRPPIFDPIIINADLKSQFYSLAPYLMADWNVGGGVRIIPGLRLPIDIYGDGAEVNVDPRLAIRWKVHPQWTLTFMGAMVHQIPPTFQSEEPFGDPSIPDVRGAQGSAGVEVDFGEGWEVKVEGFYNHLFNMARPSDQVEVTDGSFDRAFWTADMQGRAWGMELMVRKRFGGRFHGWISYTFSRAERLRPPSDWELYELDQTHILNLAFQVNLGADWSIGSRFTLTSGNPYYPITGSYYDADRDRYQPVYSTERSRLQVYHRLDLRIDKRWRFDTWMVEAYLDIQNVYNASNPESQRYSYDYSIQSEGASLPILPTLGVRAVF